LHKPIARDIVPRLTFKEITMPVNLADHLCAASSSDAAAAIPVHVVAPDEVDARIAGFTESQKAWIRAQGFEGRNGELVIVPGSAGAVEAVLFGRGADRAVFDPFTPGKLANQLPAGVYRFAEGLADARLAALGWLLESYRFDRYKARKPAPARLVVPEGVDRDALIREAEATALARDLINTPSNDMGPDELEAAARTIAERHGASIAVIRDQETLSRQFPMVHAVGKASTRLPRLIDVQWGEVAAPRLTLVGKGVCFDTGGLDIKPASGMLLMKKDMGGAANVLALASLVMAARLPVRLRVLIPAVENSIAGNAFRPGDILRSRKGLTVEIGNTDAEGRLILADALALADEDNPDLIIDMATLTGAARVALGPDLPALFASRDEVAASIQAAGNEVNDPIWPLPFYAGYDQWLDSKVADLNNVSDGGFAGAITAALFLRRFVSPVRDYVHVDLMGWNPKARPGRPIGGDAQAMRALFAYLASRYGAR
jgi:leucyl aminopeptidase